MSLSKDLAALKNPKNVSFKDALKIAEKHFGAPRIKGSHHIFKMPWQGDPRINLQPQPNNKKLAKDYQVRELVKALRRLKNESTG